MSVVNRRLTVVIGFPTFKSIRHVCYVMCIKRISSLVILLSCTVKGFPTFKSMHRACYVHITYIVLSNIILQIVRIGCTIFKIYASYNVTCTIRIHISHLLRLGYCRPYALK